MAGDPLHEPPLCAFRHAELDRRYGARLVNYADDFVVLCRRGAAEVLAQTRQWFQQMGLTLNEQKTRLCNGLQRMKGRIRQILGSGNQAPWEPVRAELNSVLRGWVSYFS